MELRLPTYLDLEQSRALLAEMGVALSKRQIQRAAAPDAFGNRKLPFFIDPIDGRLKIEKGALVRVYETAQKEAESHFFRDKA
jgi:hypothetical protein